MDKPGAKDYKHHEAEIPDHSLRLIVRARVGAAH